MGLGDSEHIVCVVLEHHSRATCLDVRRVWI